MSEKLKINCGGFYLDNETITEENGMLKVIGGGSGGGALIVHMTSDQVGSDTRYTLDKTVREIIAAMPLVYVEETSETLDGTAHFYYQFQENNIPVYIGGSDGYVFVVYVSDQEDYFPFTAETLNDYPLYLDMK